MLELAKKLLRITGSAVHGYHVEILLFHDGLMNILVLKK